MASARQHNNRALMRLVSNTPGLTRKWIADQVMVAPSTVDRWLAPRTLGGELNPTYRKMPDMALALLHYRMDDPDIPRWDA